MDPPPDKLTEQDKTSIYNNKPLVGLQWDPGEFVWKGPYEQHSNGGVQLFRYSVKLGRMLLTQKEPVTLASEKCWVDYGIYSDMRREL
mgnify:CR=1 FL=1